MTDPQRDALLIAIAEAIKVIMVNVPAGSSRWDHAYNELHRAMQEAK